MTDFYADTPAHPMARLLANPEWDAARARRADLYLADRARRYPARRPTFSDRACAFLRGFVQ